MNTDTELLLKTISESITDKKGDDGVVLDLRKLDNAVCDFFIICNGTSKIHVETIADTIVSNVKRDLRIVPTNKEGHNNAEWVLLDYFDVIIHVFQEHTRMFYQLDSLWGDAEIKKID